MLLRSVLAATLAWSVVGEFSVDLSNRIIGGNDTEAGDYPYFVDLWSCGGALIAPDIVLFAAHCEDTALNMQVNIGAYKPKSDAGGSSQPRFCDEWIADPDYEEEPVSNSDFALCKLDRPVDIHRNSTQKQVFLELNRDESLPASGDPLVVIGQGRLTEGGDVAETLQDLVVPALTNEECNRNDRYMGYITDLMFCAGYPDTGGKDSCQGDSGGPIVSRTVRDDGTVVDTHMGVVSWGVGCARERFPGVYARTSSRYDWIVDTMCNTLNSVSDLCQETSADANDDWKDLAEDDGSANLRCEGNDQNLHVKLRTDLFATETAWLLTEADSGNWVKERKYLVNEYTQDSYICLKANTCYQWEIRDGYGDGMCAKGVCGFYELNLLGETIHTGNGEFRNTETFPFCTYDKTLPPNSESLDEPESKSESLDESVDESEEGPPVVVEPPTNPPQQPINLPEPTNPPVTPAPTSICGANNFDLEFSLQVQTDDSMRETSVVMYSILPDFSDLHKLVLVDENLDINSYYTFPGDDNDNEPICLEDNTCYIFAVTDMTGDEETSINGESDGYYVGFLGGEQIFRGDYDFSKYDDRMFCTGDAFIPTDMDIDVTADPTASPTSAPTTQAPTTEEPTTGFPTQVPTKGSIAPTGSPTALPTAAPTRQPTGTPTRQPTGTPTSSPTSSPTAMPTSSPTASPTSSPTALPTVAPTDSPIPSPTTSPTSSPTAAPVSDTPSPTTAPVVCKDDPKFKFKNKKKWNCNKYLKGRNARKIKKKCNKKWKKNFVHESCPETCGKKAGVGKCSFLGKNKRRRRQNTNTVAANTKMVKLGETKGAAASEEQHIVYSSNNNDNIFSRPEDRDGASWQDEDGEDNTWLSFKNRMTAESSSTTTTKSGKKFRNLTTKRGSSNSSSKFRKLILSEMK